MKPETILKESEILMIVPDEKKASVFTLKGFFQRNAKGTVGKKYRGVLTLTKKILVFKGSKFSLFSELRIKKIEESFIFPLNRIRSVNVFKDFGLSRLEIIFQDKEAVKSYYFQILDSGVLAIGIASMIETNPLLKEWSEAINKAREKY